MTLFKTRASNLKPPRTLIRLVGCALGCAIILAAFLLQSTVAQAGGVTNQFIGGTEDLPLMAGLTEDTDAGTAFDTPGGRLVEAYAVGDVTQTAIINFYTATLPQLGWRRQGNSRFIRDQEQLVIEFSKNTEGNSQGITVRFAISPLQTDK